MTTQAQRSLEQHSAQSLLRWRWPALIFTTLVSVLLQLAEDHELNLETYVQIVVFGLFAWSLLTVLARQASLHWQREAAVKSFSRLLYDQTLYSQFDQVAQRIVEFPATILPVDHASLFIYDHLHARLEFAREWNIIAGLNSPMPRYLEEATVCQACLRSKSPTPRHTGLCAFERGILIDPAASEYCLPLKYDQILVGTLRLRCRSGKHLTREQLDFLQSMAPEIALALANSIGYARQVAYTRAEAQSHERQRLTHELHDSLAQHAFYLQLSLDQLSSDTSLDDNQAVRDKIGQLHHAAAELYDEIHFDLAALRANIAPDILTNVRALADKLAANRDLRVEVVTSGDAAELSADAAQVVLGLVREGLNNIVRHAQATRARIELSWSVERLTICLDDDGQGFDPASASQVGHYGLTLMRETVESLHGMLTITSVPGQGTRLQLSLPLQSPYPDQAHSQDGGAEAAPVEQSSIDHRTRPSYQSPSFNQS